MEPKYGQEIAKESRSNIKFHQEIRMSQGLILMVLLLEFCHVSCVLLNITEDEETKINFQAMTHLFMQNCSEE